MALPVANQLNQPLTTALPASGSKPACRAESSEAIKMAKLGRMDREPTQYRVRHPNEGRH
jgi:hypothetical protein